MAAAPTAAAVAPPAPAAGPAAEAAEQRLRLAGGAAVAAVVAAGAVLRFRTASDLWLDEALSVSIAALPTGALLEALRHDGSPPLYYLVLRAWTAVFGSGDAAVRSLSGVVSVAALAPAWLLGRRAGGRRAATAALVALASSPFAIRYATEARMYALVVLLSALLGLGLYRAAEPRPRLARAGVAACTALLLLTHYWSMFLLATVAAVLAVRARRPERRAAALGSLAAMGAGALAFLPWLPSLWWQLHHTGTPWGGPDDLTAVVTTLRDFAGPAGPRGWLLAGALAWLFALGLLGRGAGPRRIELDLRGRPAAKPAAAVAAGTVLLALGVNRVVGGAFAPRYASVALVAFLVVVALGVAAFDDRRLRAAALAVVAVGGLAGAAANVSAERTQGGQVAAALARRAGPGDVVAYCPDQLGPAVSRRAPAGLAQLTFPAGRPPERVDWVDYRAAHRAGAPAQFAGSLAAGAGRSAAVWLVYVPGYRGTEGRCEQLHRWLARLRRGRLVVARDVGGAFESMELWRFAARSASRLGR